MPNVKIPRPDPTQLYVCVMSHTDAVDAVRAGARLRGDHPDVLRYPQFFVADGTDDVTRRRLLQERFPDSPLSWN